MKKIILIVSLMLAPFALANLAEARPNNENTQVSQQPVKKKKKHTKKKPVKKVQEIKATQPTSQLAFNDLVFHTNDESASQYWAREHERQERERQQQVASSLGLKKQNPVQKKPTTLEVRKNCFWFVCNEEVVKPVYAEAKKWEGKNAKKHRGELKNLMAAGNNNQPVDPVRIPWCAGFVNAILARSGYETTGSLMARSFLHYGIVTKEPEVGDIVVTKRGSNQMAGHVGFFEGYEWFEGVKYIKVYGGNTAKSVQVGYFPVNQILGYRKPVVA
jgi:uncharacterized protein (TIGR02594 family)